MYGEATGGTLLRISGLNFDNAFKFSQQSSCSPARSTTSSTDSSLSHLEPRALARTQSFLPHAARPPPNINSFSTSLNAVRQSNNTSHTDTVPLSPVNISHQSKIRSMRRTMSVRLGNDSKATLSTEVTMTGHGSNPNLNVYVLVRLGSPTTGRILHRTAVKGVLIRLSSTQVLSTSLAGASAFAALAGANDNLQPRDSTVWGRMPEQDPTPDRLATSLHPSTGVGIAAAEHAAKMLGPDCMVQCRTPPCPLALLLNASSFVATVEVSLNGSDGQFSCDNVQYEYVRPLTLKAVLPQGDQLVPGCSVLMLKGHSIVSSKALTIHMSLLAAPEGGTSTFGHVRTLERLVLSYKTIQRRLNTAVEAGAVGPLAGEDPDFTQVCASVPFFIRRRYFNCHARCLPMFARVTSHTANMSPGCCAERFGYIVSVRELRLWVHSQPVADDTKRRLDTENAASKLDISAAEKGMRVRRASIRRQMSSSPQRNLLRQLSRTESLKHSGNSLVRQLSDLAEPGRRVGRNSSQRLLASPHSTGRSPAERFKRSGSQFRLGERQISRSAIPKQGAEVAPRRNFRPRGRASGILDTPAPQKGNHALTEPDCLVNEINVELSPNGQDWTERASRKVQLATPHSLGRVEPALGPTRGGSTVLIHGDHFPTIGENCVIGFLCLGSCDLPICTQVMEVRSRNLSATNFIDINIASLESHSAARKIQAASRGRLLRALARNGVPCICVTGTLVSSKIISCVAPAVLTGGRTDIIVSFDGINFEWAPTEKFKQCL